MLAMLGNADDGRGIIYKTLQRGWIILYYKICWVSSSELFPLYFAFLLGGSSKTLNIAFK
jgi:hypothetical protein